MERDFCKLNILSWRAAPCVYGDSKAPFDDGTTCTTRLAKRPWFCYQDYFNDTCCRTCQQLRNQHSSGLSVSDCQSVVVSRHVALLVINNFDKQLS